MMLFVSSSQYLEPYLFQTAQLILYLLYCLRIRFELSKSDELGLIDPLLQKLQVVVKEGLSQFLIVLFDSMLYAGFFLVDFAYLFGEEGLEEEGLLADAHYFGVVFDHSNGTLVTVQSVPALFFLKGRLFEVMVGTPSLINLLLLQVFLDHLLRKQNGLLFAALGVRLLCFEVFLVPTEGRQSIG